MKTNQSPRPQQSPIKDLTSQFVIRARSGWNALTDTERGQWNVQARNYTFQNSFGDTLQYNGFQFYMKQNVKALQAGFPLVVSAQNLDPAIDNLRATGYEINIAGFGFFGFGPALPANQRIIIKGYRYSKGSDKINPDEFVYLGNLSTYVELLTTFFVLFAPRFGTVQNGQFIYVTSELVNRDGFSVFPELFRVAYS